MRTTILGSVLLLASLVTLVPRSSLALPPVTPAAPARAPQGAPKVGLPTIHPATGVRKPAAMTTKGAESTAKGGATKSVAKMEIAKPVLKPRFDAKPLVDALKNGQVKFNKRLYQDIVDTGLDPHFAYTAAALATPIDETHGPLMNEAVFRDFMFHGNNGQEGRYGVDGIITLALVVQQQPNPAATRKALLGKTAFSFRKFTLDVLHDEVLDGPVGGAREWSDAQYGKAVDLMESLGKLADARVGLPPAK